MRIVLHAVSQQCSLMASAGHCGASQTFQLLRLPDPATTVEEPKSQRQCQQKLLDYAICSLSFHCRSTHTKREREREEGGGGGREGSGEGVGERGSSVQVTGFKRPSVERQ